MLGVCTKTLLDSGCSGKKRKVSWYWYIAPNTAITSSNSIVQLTGRGYGGDGMGYGIGEEEEGRMLGEGAGREEEERRMRAREGKGMEGGRNVGG